MRKIYDPLYKFISIEPLLQVIIDTFEFQRLRDIKQLGATHYVFPSATHTRFEHSIGVAYLAEQLILNLKVSQPELGITDNMVLLVKIAGLIHDIGHGPYSHLYDHYVKDEYEDEHEVRGIEIFIRMVEKYNIGLSKEDVNVIIDLVEPSESVKNNWYYQIVNNKVNTIDVDKLDYIRRDCFHLNMPLNCEIERLLYDVKVVNYNNNMVLAWNEKLQFDIYNLFACRYKLHKQVYSHHTVKAIEYVLVDIMKEIKKNVEFIKLTDSVITSYMIHNNINIISERQHPRLIGEKLILDDVNTINIDKDDKYIYDKINIGFTTGEKENPLSNVYYFNKTSVDGFRVEINDLSFLIPDKFKETIIRLYKKTSDVDEKDKIIWNNILININFYI